ncbi:MAG: hypothetical protein ACXAD7_24775 [Candidatus Kariarchaeaceae archaeon]|jgi:hypothetical protein
MTPKVIHVTPDVNGSEVITKLGIQNNRPLVFLISGAKYLQNEDKINLQIEQGLVTAITSMGAIVIDGATTAGAMKFLNDSLGAVNYSGPYIGIIPYKKAKFEERIWK